MADKKFSELGLLEENALQTTDELIVRDKSDTTFGPAGTEKRYPASSIFLKEYDVKYISLSGTTTSLSSKERLAQKLNTSPQFTVRKPTIYIIFGVSSYTTYFEKYLHLAGYGVFGAGATQISANYYAAGLVRLDVISSNTTLDPNDLAETDTISNSINAGSEYDTSIRRIFRRTIIAPGSPEGVRVFAYIGNQGVIGGAQPDVAEADFEDITSDGSAPSDAPLADGVVVSFTPGGYVPDQDLANVESHLRGISEINQALLKGFGVTENAGGWYEDQAALIADQVNQEAGYFYYVSADDEFYRYLAPGTPAGDITDYQVITLSSGGGGTSNEVANITALKATTGYAIGDYAITTAYYSGVEGGGVYQKVDPTGLTSNDIDLIEATDGSYWQLVSTGTITPYQFGVITEDETTTARLQRFFDFCNETKAVGDFRGKWLVDATIIIDGNQYNSYYCGEVNPIAAGVDTVLDIRNLGSKFLGQLSIIGTTDVSYTSRNSNYAITRANANGGRNYFQSIEIKGFRKWGIKSTSGSTVSQILDKYDNIKVWNCGSGNSSTRKLAFDITGYVNNGVHSNSNQTAVIDVPVIDEGLEDFSLLRINGRVHYILENGIDTVNNQITIYPWVDSTITASVATPYEIESMHGGGIDIFGQNSASIQIDQIDGLGCGSIVRSSGLYGADIGVIQGQFSYNSLVLGRTASSNNLGSIIRYLYCEGSVHDILQVTKVDTKTVVANTAVFKADRAYKVNYVDNNNTVYPTLLRVNANYEGKIYNGTNKVSENLAGSLVNFTIQNGDDPTVIYADSKTIDLKWREDINHAWGHDNMKLEVWGSGAEFKPTGTITFELDATDQANGITVMGGTSYALSSFKGVANFSIEFNYANQDWEIQDFNNIGGESNTFEDVNIINVVGGALKFTRDDGTIGDGDRIGAVEFYGNDNGVDEVNRKGAEIEVVASNAWGVGSEAKADIVFKTRKTEAQTPIERMRINYDGVINFANAPVYADDAAAGTGGLVTGDVYQTGAGVLMIKQ